MLPKQNAIRYEITIPSTGKKCKYRPFTVREEKALLLAKESEDLDTKMATIKTVIEACLEPKPDTEKLAAFDLQYIMVMLRTKSVGENVRILFECGACPRVEGIPLDLDLTKIEVVREDKHTNKIPLFDDVGVVMKYPSIQQIELLDQIQDEPIKIIDLLADLIEYVYDKEELHHGSEQTHTQLVDFIEALTKDQFAKLTDFIRTMPKIVHTAKFTCPDCSTEHTRLVEGFSSFFY
jgi:hypothetical protein